MTDRKLTIDIPVALEQVRSVHSIGTLEFEGDLPAAMLRSAQQSGEAGGRIEAWPAQPVDRPVAADQSCGLAVTDQRVIFNRLGHYCSVKSMTPMNTGEPPTST